MGGKGEQALRSPGLSCSSLSLGNLQADHMGGGGGKSLQRSQGWQTKVGNSPEDRWIGPQYSPTKSRSLVASMLLTVMAPKFSSGRRGKVEGNRDGLEGKEGPLQPGMRLATHLSWDPFQRGGRERVSCTGPRREVGTLSLPRAMHPHHRPSLVSLTSVSISKKSRCHPDPCPLCKTRWELMVISQGAGTHLLGAAPGPHPEDCLQWPHCRDRGF